MTTSDTSAATASAIAATTGAAKTSKKATIASDFNSFLLLLTTQLKNQSPLDPLDTNQFTQQLVQFSQVEQQIKSNDTLQELLSSTRNTMTTNALNFIGTTVSATGNTSKLRDDKAEWRLNPTRDVAEAVITIKDKSGNVVKNEIKALTAGDQIYAWNGRNTVGALMSEADYTLTVTGKDALNQTVPISTALKGKVDEVDLKGANPTLVIGGVAVPISSVLSIQ
jgi:flagellar basal-body rod modification protein FlgD